MKNKKSYLKKYWHRYIATGVLFVSTCVWFSDGPTLVAIYSFMITLVIGVSTSLNIANDELIDAQNDLLDLYRKLHNQ
jgi:uncharacterized membrane protein